MSLRKNVLLPTVALALVFLFAGCEDSGGGKRSSGSSGGSSGGSGGPEAIELTIHSPQLNGLYNTASPSLVYTATEGVQQRPIPDSRVEATVANLANGEPVSSVPVSNVASGSALPRLDEGEHMLALIVKTPSGNPAVTVNVNFATDTVKPSITVSGLDSVISDPSPVIYYATDEEGDITVFLDGAPVTLQSGQPLRNPDGTVRVLADGSHTITVVVTDSAQNTSVRSVTFTVDTKPPQIQVDNSIPDGGVTNAPQDVTFTSDENGEAQVFIDNSLVETINVSAGTPVVVPLTNITPGEHTVSIEIRDLVNNVTVTSRTFTFDPNAPTVTITAPKGLINTQTFTLTCFATDDSSTALSVALALETYWPGSDSWTSQSVDAQCGDQLTIAADGRYRLVVAATDASNNTGLATSEFQIDSTAPVVQISQPAASATNISSPRLTFSSSEPGRVSVFLRSGGASNPEVPISTQSGGTLGPLADGNYTVIVEVKDDAQNVGRATRTFSIDATAPVVRVISPVDGSTIGTAAPILTFKTGEQGNAVLTINSTPVQPFAVSASEHSVNLGTLPHGANTVTVGVVDALGNVAPRSVSFTIDVNAPAVTITKPSGLKTSRTVPFEFSVNDEYTLSEMIEVTAFLDRLQVDSTGQTVVASTTSIENPLTGTLTVPVDGMYRVRVVASDLVGNSGQASKDFNVDTTAPSIGVLSPANNSVVQTGTPLLLVESSENLFEVVVYLFKGAYRDDYGSAEQTSLQLNQPITLADGSPLSDGTWTVVVTAEDVAGWNGKAYATFTVDAVGPSVSIESPTNGQTFTNNAFPLRYHVHDASVVELWINGELITTRPIDPVEPDPRTYVENLRFPADGSYRLRLVAKDTTSDRHADVETSITVVIDALKSNVSITSPAAPDNQFRGEVPVAFTISNSVSAVVRLDGAAIREYTDLGGLNSSFSDSFNIGPFSDNRTYVLEIIASDGAETVTASAQFVVDTLPPQVLIDTPAQGAVIEADVFTLLYRALDENPIVAQQVWLDGTTLAGVASGSTIGPLSNGSYQIDVSASDKAGNSSTARVTFSIDKPLPPPPPEDDDETPPDPDDGGGTPPPDDGSGGGSGGDDGSGGGDDNNRPGRRWGSSCILDAVRNQVRSMAELRICIEQRRQNWQHRQHDDDDNEFWRFWQDWNPGSNDENDFWSRWNRWLNGWQQGDRDDDHDDDGDRNRDDDDHDGNRNDRDDDNGNRSGRNNR